jgi:hypothetical protein
MYLLNRKRRFIQQAWAKEERNTITQWKAKENTRYYILFTQYKLNKDNQEKHYAARKNIYT